MITDDAQTIFLFVSRFSGSDAFYEVMNHHILFRPCEVMNKTAAGGQGLGMTLVVFWVFLSSLFIYYSHYPLLTYFLLHSMFYEH